MSAEAAAPSHSHGPEEAARILGHPYTANYLRTLARKDVISHHRSKRRSIVFTDADLQRIPDEVHAHQESLRSAQIVPLIPRRAATHAPLPRRSPQPTRRTTAPNTTWALDHPALHHPDTA